MDPLTNQSSAGFSLGPLQFEKGYLGSVVMWGARVNKVKDQGQGQGQGQSQDNLRPALNAGI